MATRQEGDAERARTASRRRTADDLGRSGSRSRSTDGSVIRQTDAVYAQLRREIVEGELRPNVALIETDLAERLEVSRTPIREALQRLAVDGLIRGRARGWVVHEHTRQDIQEIYETRIALEGYATFLAAERATDAELETIATIQRECLEEVRAGRLREKIVDLDLKFHEAIFATARNSYLVSLTRKNRDFYFNHRIASLYSDDELRESILSQGAVAKYVLARSPRRAEIAARKHVEQALSVILTKLR